MRAPASPKRLRDGTSAVSPVRVTGRLVGVHGAYSPAALPGSNNHREQGEHVKRRISKLSAAVASVLVLSFIVLPAPAADARTDNRSKPVVYVHGYNAFGDGTDCNMWSSMDNTLRSWGLTGQKVTVRYYFGDVNCTHALQSFGTNGRHY